MQRPHLGWIVSLFALFSLVLAGCGSTAPTTPAASAPTATEAAPAEAAAPTDSAESPAAEATDTPSEAEAPATSAGKDDVLRLLWWQAPTMLNPHLATGSKDWEATRAVYEPLASFNGAGELIPFLAAEIPSLENGGVAADGRSVTWKLKEGVVWADGQPFTAEDVKFTYEYVSDPDTAATTVALYGTIESIEVVDELTVKLNFKEPNPAWALPFVGYEGLILPKHVFQDFMGAEARNAPANMTPFGTGPYKVVDFKPGDTVSMVANELYREEGKPYFGRIELQGGSDAASAARAVLQTGDTDFAWNLQVEVTLLEQFLAGGAGDLIPNPGPNVERILLNRTDPTIEVNGERSSAETENPFFSDERVRKAFGLAVDRDTIAKQLYGVSGTATSNLLVAPTNYASPNTSYEYDLEKAKALLEEAGWVDSDGDGVREKDGKKLSILFQTSVNPVRQKTQEIVKASLTQVGFEVELKSIDNGVFFSSDPGNPDTYYHFYADAQMYTGGNSSPDPGSAMEDWTCAEFPQQSNQWVGGNLARWCNPEYDALHAQSKVELDPEKRAQLFIQMNDLMIEDGFVIPLVHRAFPSGASVTLDNIELTPWDANLWRVQDWTRKP
jgi:peptide/nickel transport system substrate-binding protein